MNKPIILFLVVFFVFAAVGIDSAFADKIRHKFGQVLEGKLKERRAALAGDNWCTGPDQDGQLLDRF